MLSIAHPNPEPFSMLSALALALLLADDSVAIPPVSDRAANIHASGILIDGHNDLPWRLREIGDFGLESFDLRVRHDEGHTDIPRLREGGVDGQFWSVYIPSEHPNPAETVLQQIDLVYRMIDKYPDVFELALTADDVERIAAEGKIASLIGIEGGVAIQDDLALLRTFARLGVRYMTLTHNTTLDWADAATGEAKHDGLTSLGEDVVREMNRLGILVDISHVSAATMDDVLRVTSAPVIASHSSARAVCDHPRNVPDTILTRVKENGGVIMVNFYPSFVLDGVAAKVNAARKELHEKHPVEAEYDAAYNAWAKEHEREIRGNIAKVADHVDHIVKVAGIDHVGLGGDFDGIERTPIGLEDVSTYPRLTDELLRRGYSESDLHKLLGGNVLRAMRGAEKASLELKSHTQPIVQKIAEPQRPH
jgi:membrane dipeptidase